MRDQPVVEGDQAEGREPETVPEVVTAQQLRRGIVEIDDRVRALPVDAFDEKYRLQREADELRRVLSDLGESDEATLSSWSARAASKNARVFDQELELAKANIPNPNWM